MNEIYQDCFAVCNVVKDEDGCYKLDLPFPIYHMEIFDNGRRCYDSIPHRETEVMVHLSYHPDDEEKVKAFPGYMGKIAETEKVMSHPKYSTHWKETEAEAKAVISIDENTLEETVTLYEGKDKDKLSKCSRALK